jgi:hypothetical protein
MQKLIIIATLLIVIPSTTVFVMWTHEHWNDDAEVSCDYPPCDDLGDIPPMAPPPSGFSPPPPGGWNVIPPPPRS